MSGTRMSLLYSFTEKYALLLVSLAASMLVSRLLTPQEIGMYSVGAVLLGVVQVLRDFGVGQYVVQERALDKAQLRAVLTVSYLFAWVLAALVALCALPVAHFYGEPRLGPMLQLLALNFVLIPFTAVTLPMLRRELRFGAICAINLCHGVCGALVSVLLAWQGYGFMSLALASVAATGAGLAASVWLRPSGLPWLPALGGIRRVLRFGVYATGGNLIDEAGVAAPDLVIGKIIGMDAVGVFGKAFGAMAVFHRAITNAASPVLFSLYAAQARAGEDVRAAYLLTVTYMTALAWPFFACLALMALPAVRLLYGDQWDAAAPLIRIMCFSSAIYSMSSMARYLFVAHGHVKEQARLDACAVAMRVLLLLVAAPFGLVAVAWAVVGGTVLRAWLTLRCLHTLHGIGPRPLAAAAAKSLLLTPVAALGPAGAMLTVSHPAAQALLGGAAALAMWLAGIVVLRHPLIDELHLARRKLTAALTH